MLPAQDHEWIQSGRAKQIDSKSVCDTESPDAGGPRNHRASCVVRGTPISFATSSN